jgi:hypothetical protein
MINQDRQTAFEAIREMSYCHAGSEVTFYFDKIILLLNIALPKSIRIESSLALRVAD